MGYSYMGTFQDPSSSGTFHDADDGAQDVMLLRFFCNNGPDQDRYRKGHQDPGIQQAAQSPYGLLLATEER